MADAPGGEFQPGQTVATVMGGMGRKFDGSYAEYTMVPAGQVQAFSADLSWATLGARSAGADRFFLDDGAIARRCAGSGMAASTRCSSWSGQRHSKTRSIARESPASCAWPGWSLADFAPMDIIPSAVSLTTCSGGVSDFMVTPLQHLIDRVSAGALAIPPGRVFHIDDIVEAHRMMETDRAGGKIVVLTR